jgi:YXWGXW repeat-containing protein
MLELKFMNAMPRYACCLSISLVTALLVTGCRGNQNQEATNASPASPDQSQSQGQVQDPTSANIVPISNTNAANAAPQDTNGAYSDQGAPSASPDQQYYDDSGYGEQVADTAPQPPPPLPTYDQPDCPGDDYIWTPGYWSYAQDGYYWVPGAWVEAPYQGALWTPGYWGYDRGHRHYAFYRGYWGPHIGYYGGINYGFGYVGFGYQGGYWNQGHFDYNRSVNRVNVNQVHYVYNRTVVYNNTYNTRISYNGGSGGINVRPRPAELAAIHEQHAPPMTAQVQHAQQARADRANFAAVNRGNPANPVVTRPLAADHNIRPPAQIAARNAAQQQPRRAPEPMRPNAAPSPAAARGAEANRGVPQSNALHTQSPQQTNHPTNQPQQRGPMTRPAAPPTQAPQARPAPQYTRPQPGHPQAARPTPAPVQPRIVQPQPQHTAPPAQRVAPMRPAPPAAQPQRLQPPRPVAPQHAPPPSRPAPQAQSKPSASRPAQRPDDKHPHQ